MESKTIATPTTAITITASENVRAKTDNRHVMALLDADENIVQIQIADDNGRDELEDAAGDAPGSTWACLTRKSLGNFTLLNQIPTGVEVTLHFRTEGGSFFKFVAS